MLNRTSRLLNYTPSATCVRLLTVDALIAHITTQTLYLSGASVDPRMLLPAWIAIATVSTYSYKYRVVRLKEIVDSYNGLPPYPTED